MSRKGDNNGRSAQLLAASGTVNHAIVAAVSNAGRRNVVLKISCSLLVTDGSDLVGNIGFSAFAEIGGISAFRTGGSGYRTVSVV